MTRPDASSPRARTSRRPRTGRRDRRHLIAWLESLEPRLMLDSKLAQLSATVSLLARTEPKQHPVDHLSPTKPFSEHGLALTNTILIQDDEVTTARQTATVAADLAKPHKHALADKERSHRAQPLNTRRHLEKTQPHSATRPRQDETERHSQLNGHAANLHRESAIRHRRKHRSPGNTNTTTGSSNGIKPLVGGGPPVANNDAYTVFHDHALIATTAASGVLANDTDPNGYTLTAVEETGPRHGTLTLNSNGTFVYMPSAGYYGTDSFTYEAYDGHNDSSPATVSITVQETAPVAKNESLTVFPDRAYSGATSATDTENDAVTAALVANPTHGTVTLNSNGAFTYTPNTGTWAPIASPTTSATGC